MRTENTLDFFSLMLDEAARNPNLDEFMTGQGDKRREEGANPAPPKPKAKITKPKREASPEEPSNTGARASTDIPQAKAKASPKKEAKASPKKEAKPEEPKTKTKPVKKDIPHKKPIEQKGNTPLIYSDLQEYLNNMKCIGVIRERLALRKMPGLTPGQWKSVGKKISAKQDLVKLIFEYDKKNEK